MFVYETSNTHGVTSAGEDGRRGRKRGWVGFPHMSQPSRVALSGPGVTEAEPDEGEGLWSVAVCKWGWLRVMECFREVRTRR